MYSPALPFFSTHKYPTSARRARLKAHFVQVAVELLTGYENLSDGARITYLVLLSFDYSDSEHGDHKGIVFPSIETLMAKRNKSRSTIYSHLAELEAHGLIAPVPGVGWRLYNPPECPQDPQPTIDLADNTEAATDNDSARETDVQTSLPGADTPMGKAAFACTPEFRKSGPRIKEEEEEMKHIQYSEAGESRVSENSLVVNDLEKFGFAAWLARKFVQQYGSERVKRQVTHLAAERSRGVPIQNCARWLYRAIERDYQFPHAPIQKHSNTEKPHFEIGALMTLPSGEVVYELVAHTTGSLRANSIAHSEY